MARRYSDGEESGSVPSLSALLSSLHDLMSLSQTPSKLPQCQRAHSVHVRVFPRGERGAGSGENVERGPGRSQGSRGAHTHNVSARALGEKALRGRWEGAAAGAGGREARHHKGSDSTLQNEEISLQMDEA